MPQSGGMVLELEQMCISEGELAMNQKGKVCRPTYRTSVRGIVDVSGRVFATPDVERRCDRFSRRDCWSGALPMLARASKNPGTGRGWVCTWSLSCLRTSSLLPIHSLP